jgi:hypothetical protein
LGLSECERFGAALVAPPGLPIETGDFGRSEDMIKTISLPGQIKLISTDLDMEGEAPIASIRNRQTWASVKGAGRNRAMTLNLSSGLDGFPVSNACKKANPSSAVWIFFFSGGAMIALLSQGQFGCTGGRTCGAASNFTPTATNTVDTYDQG